MNNTLIREAIKSFGLQNEGSILHKEKHGIKTYSHLKCSFLRNTWHICPKFFLEEVSNLLKCYEETSVPGWSE
jgi:hypothetical protein